MAKYSTKNKAAETACRELGFYFCTGFVSALRRKNKIYINFTLGKPDEIRALMHAVKKNEHNGYALCPRLRKFHNNNFY